MNEFEHPPVGGVGVGVGRRRGGLVRGRQSGGDWEGVVQALHAISFLFKGPIRFENVH